jgi:hypothetical protein
MLVARPAAPETIQQLWLLGRQLNVPNHMGYVEGATEVSHYVLLPGLLRGNTGKHDVNGTQIIPKGRGWLP